MKLYLTIWDCLGFQFSLMEVSCGGFSCQERHQYVVPPGGSPVKTEWQSKLRRDRKREGEKKRGRGRNYGKEEEGGSPTKIQWTSWGVRGEGEVRWRVQRWVSLRTSDFWKEKPQEIWFHFLWTFSFVAVLFCELFIHIQYQWNVWTHFLIKCAQTFDWYWTYWTLKNYWTNLKQTLNIEGSIV